MVFGNLFKSESPTTGSKAPDFTLLDQDGKPVSLSNFRGKWVVLFFYPKDFSLGCTAEVCSFRDNFSNFQKIDAILLGVNTDTVESHRDFVKKHQLPFSLLSDKDGEVSKNYGVLLFGKVSNRETFFISPEGQIKDKLSWVNWFQYADSVSKKLAQLKGGK
jgi:peroxiredoxin Q/BCP